MSVTTENPKLQQASSQDDLAPSPQGRRAIPALSVLLPTAAIALVAVLYWGAMTWWLDEWTRAGSFYAHGIFIPFFVAIMVWRDRERLRRLPLDRCWWGLGLIVFALALALASARAQVFVPISLSFIILLVGTTLVVAGRRVTRALLFPMLFLATMIPIIPDQLINPIAFPIQVISAKMAAALCSLVGFSAHADMTKVTLEHYTLSVELPCSGFKTLLGLVSFSAAFAYVVDGEKWKRWLLFVMSAPLAIIVNGLRITLIGLVGELFGSDAAKHFHDYSGFIVLVLGFTFLFNMARVLRCDNFLGVPLIDEPRKKRDDGAQAEPGEDRAPEEKKADIRSAQAAKEATAQAEYDAKWGSPRRGSLASASFGFYPVVGLLMLALAVKPAMPKPATPIAAVSSREIPVELNGGEWKAQEVSHNVCDIPITPEVEEALHPSSYINRIYTGSAAEPGPVELLLTAGNGRKVFHDPHTCFPSGGYDMHDVRVETIDTPAGPVKMQVSELENKIDHSRSLMMFCYLVDGAQYQSTQRMNTALMWQLLFGDSGRPSYFLRFRHMTPGTDSKHQNELKSVIRAVWSAIAPKAAGASNANRVVAK
jgi:exosortase